MDAAFLSAIWRAPHLPPPDPWLAGYPINYYYFGHFLLAAAGLVIWIAYVALHTKALAWTAFGVLLPVAALGFVMLLRWLPAWRPGRVLAAGGGPGTASVNSAAGIAGDPAERHLPVPVIFGHGIFAVVTLLLVLLTAAGVS